MHFRLHNLIILIGVFILFITINSCDREVIKNYPEIPENPFDGIDYSDGVLPEIPIDSSTLLGLHTYIFSKTCAQPGCHDGNFEPDFRTVQSTYNTLVYHSVIKNDEDESFQYRVSPGNRNASWLYERVTTDDAVLGRMPLYDTLTPHEIEQIGLWIDNGAKDIFGQIAVLPDFQPYVYGWNAFVNDTNGLRLDTLRADLISPMVLPPSTNVEFWFFASDITPDGYLDWGYGWELEFNKAKISDHPYEFDASSFIDMDVQPALQPYSGYTFFTDGSFTAPFFHKFSINTSEFTPGRTQFVRLYLQDEDHAQPIEFPRLGTPTYLVSLMSFVVSP